MKEMTSACNRKNLSFPCAWILQRRRRKAQPELLISANIQLPNLFNIETHFPPVLRLASSATWPRNTSPKTAATYPGVRCRCHSPDRSSTCGLPNNLITLAWAEIKAAYCGFGAHRNTLTFIQAVLARSAGVQKIVNWASTINRRDQVYSKAITDLQPVE